MKKIISILTSILLATSVFAFEWGGMIGASEYTKDTIGNLSFKQYADIDLWFRHAFSKNLSMAGDIFYSFDYNFDGSDFESASERKLDLNSFFLKGDYQLGSSDWDIGFSVGRFVVADATSLVLAQKIDGIGVSFSSAENISLKLYGGYTGFLNKKTNEMYAPYYTEDETFLEIYTVNVPYFITGFSTNFESLFADQNLCAEVLAAIDQSLIYNQVYVDFSLDGPIYKSLYYAFATSGEMIFDQNAEKTFDWGALAKFEIMYFFNWNSLTLDASAVYMTDTFTPISQAEASIDGAYYNSIMKTGLTASAKFLGVLFVTLGVDAVFDDENYAPTYSGIQYDVALRYQVLDDLQLSASAAQLFYADTTQPSYLSVKGSVRLSF